MQEPYQNEKKEESSFLSQRSELTTSSQYYLFSGFLLFMNERGLYCWIRDSTIILARMRVPKFGQKWFLFFEFRYFWTVLWIAVFLCFFAVSSFLKSAEMFGRLNGMCTSSIDGFERTVETCFLSLGGNLPFQHFITKIENVYSFHRKLWISIWFRSNFFW